MATRVLLIDDERHIRTVLAESLGTAGFDVTQAASGEEALALLPASPQDLLVVDLKMPGMSGLDFIREAAPLTLDAQAVILTGFGDMATAVEALRLGAYDYLTKPVDLDRLVQTLQKAAERRTLLHENRDLLRRLQEANRIKAEFINGMSHEVRTPLGHITGFTQILQDTLEGLSDKQRRYLQNIHDAATRLLTMFDNILQFTTLKSGDVSLHIEPVRLSDVLDGVAESLRAQAADKGIAVSTRCEVDGIIHLDKDSLARALRLLLDNAVKFTPSGGRVSLTASERDRAPEGAGGLPGDSEGWLALAVRDTGIGIAPGDRKRIFNLFEQVDGSLARSYEGTGIGLPLARSLAHIQGGTIEVDSEPGKGSTFTLVVPRLRPV